MSFSSWFQGGGVSEAEIRAEIWRLGASSLGWPLEAALDELKSPNLSPDRARLLRACARRLRP